MCVLLHSFVEIEMRRAYRSFFYALCACIEIGPIALPCLSSIYRLKNPGRISTERPFFVEEWSRRKARALRTILTTKAADTKASELLIRQFLCPRRAARVPRDPRRYKISNFIYRHRRRLTGRFSDSCQYRLLGGFLARPWGDLRYQQRGGTFSLARPFF